MLDPKTLDTSVFYLSTAYARLSLGCNICFQVLKIAAPPYEMAFMRALHPLVTHPDISDGLRAGKDTEFVNEFLGENYDLPLKTILAH